ncbi:MAG: site-specific integrase [Oscillospiraceae bacterium]|nr:site-specific integrase [Oscillospiraceae bacterium]
MAKRGNSEGCIVKDPRNGNYIARIQIGYNSNGNPKIKTFSGKTVTEVKRRLKEFKDENENNQTIAQGDCLLVEGMYRWLEKYKKPFLKPSSYDRLMQTVSNNIIPYIGQYYIKEITLSDIQTEVINRLTSEKLSRSSIKKAYQALNMFFRQYIIERKLTVNPMDGVRLPLKEHFEEKTIKPLTPDEMDKFTRTAMSKFDGNGEYKYRYGTAFVFVLYTGLREGEALALQYKHIDLANRKVTVEQNLVMVTDGSGNKRREPLIQKSTKTSSGKREIPLCDTAYEAIKLYMDMYYTGNDEEYIFTTKKGNHLTPHNMAKSVNYIFKAAGIDASGMHILRHSFASYLHSKGVDIKYISAILGHSGTQITYDTYVHTNYEQLKSAMDMID